MSLRAKLLLAVLACGLLPTLLVGLLAYRAGARAVEDSLRADAEAAAAQLARQLEIELPRGPRPTDSTGLPAGLSPPPPVAVAAQSERQRQGTLVAQLVRALEENDSGGMPSRRIVAVSADGRIVHHPNAAFTHRPVREVVPHFEGTAREMSAGRAGSQFFTDPADGSLWLAAYRPVAGIAGADFSVAVARNYSAAVAAPRRAALLGVAACALLACAMGAFAFLTARGESRAVASVAVAAARVGGGDLDQRVEAGGGGETRALVENFNLMTDRLREQIAREGESRQFQSFFRLSAMLTHDLKNAIAGLSILVSNMERQSHREEFRADAVRSLHDATEKLRSIVARLSEPLVTLSGEYRRALRRTDLVPLVRRVLDAHAASGFHEIETDLPVALEATVDAERVERVLENLVINALEAMGATRGRLTVAAGREGGSQIFLSVADTGPGMSDDFIRTRLFRPFATTKVRGVGLGLYTCREVVEAHGGRIEVESKLGSGARFRVVLPSDPVTHSRAAATGPPGGG